MRPYGIVVLMAWFLPACLLAQAGYVDIMPAEKMATYRPLLPKVSDPQIQSYLSDPGTMWYDGTSIVPAYQDSAFDPMGMRPNTIDPELINLAVPGGWADLFQRSGRFNFPFATGGSDLCDNLVTINFWWVPRDSGGNALPVVYWKMGDTGNFLRWRWMFPVGTTIGEVHLVQFPDNDLRVTEIRARTRAAGKWTNRVFRPFPTANDLAAAIVADRPQWQTVPALSNLVTSLRNPATLTARTLQSDKFADAFDTVNGYLDFVPDFGDTALVKQLLSETTFQNVAGIAWKTNGAQTTYAASTQQSYGITPRLYDGGMLPVDDTSCARCHNNAGRQFNDFYPDLAAYGDLWGEDDIFSWHPFETSSFVDSSGAVVNFDDDNRTLRQDLVDAGLVVPYDPSVHPTSLYSQLQHTWTYNQW